jgi:hypothetical protein
METRSQPRIVSAERLADGVVVTFDDGRCAVYSVSLLYTTLPQAEEVPEPMDEE